MTPKKEILRNAIRCPDGVVLESRYRYDYVEHTAADGRHYAVDGGLEDISRGYHIQDYEELTLYTTDTHADIREGFSWGSYGECGTLPLRYTLLKDLGDKHLEALMGYVRSEKILKVMRDEVEWRKKCIKPLDTTTNT